MKRTFSIERGRVRESGDGRACVSVYIQPDDAERKHLLTHYRLDEHTLTSALDPDELARIEYEPTHVALIIKRPRNYSADEHFLFRVSSYGIFVFKHRLVIVMSENTPLFDGRFFLKISSIEDIVLGLIYRNIYHFLEHLKIINAVSEALERKINASMSNRYLLDLFTLEKSLVFYVSAINSNGAVIGKLRTNAQKLRLSAENLETLEDISIENAQCLRQSEIYSDILASMMDARASIVNNNLNVLMKTLNIVTIGIMVPTFVVSAFSMNVKIPLADSPYAFWIIMSLAGCSVLAFMLTWRFKNRQR